MLHYPCVSSLIDDHLNCKSAIQLYYEEKGVTTVACLDNY